MLFGIEAARAPARNSADARQSAYASGSCRGEVPMCHAAMWVALAHRTRETDARGKRPDNFADGAQLVDPCL